MPALDRYINLDYFLVRRDGKNCAIPSLHRDILPAKVTGSWSDAASGNAYSLNRRAVMFKPSNACYHDKFIWTMA